MPRALRPRGASGPDRMLRELGRVFFGEPLRGLLRFAKGEVVTFARLFGRVLLPDVDERPTEESVLENAGHFFRFLSHWVVVQISVMELSGTDSDLLAEANKYFLLLATYLFGFCVNYGIVAIGRRWSKFDFLSNVNSVADFYNLFFLIAFVINLALGKFNVGQVGSGDLQFRVLMSSFAVLGTVFFVVLRVRKLPLHAFTWFLIMAADSLIHTFNMAMLNQVVYQAM